MLNDVTQVTYGFDSLLRKNKTVLNAAGNYKVLYSYKNGVEKNTTTNQLSAINYGSGTNALAMSYEYDANGNISKVFENSVLKNQYYYDSINQLVREDIVNVKTIVYTYDTTGNITSKKEYPYNNITGSIVKEDTYAYGDTNWKDKLTSFNGTAITYDEIGNPITYKGANLTWDNGRRLKYYFINPNNRARYEYNDAGMRIKKTDANIDTNYVYNGTQLVAEYVNEYNMSNKKLYFYDESGNLYAMKYYDDNMYYYIRNATNDIIKLLDSNGIEVVSYTYNDAYGKDVTISGTMKDTLGRQNPFRYKSYYFDSDTGLYYISSRYYDPEIGRWICPEPNVDCGEFDDGAGLIGYNVFAYCANNPVNNIDPTGEFVISTAVLIGIGIGALIGGVAGGTYGYNKAVKSNVPKGQRWKYVVGYGLGGAVVGGVIGGFVGYGVGVALGAKASSGVVIKSVSKAISSIGRNSINHIMQSKHAWGSVLRRATWNKVKGLINTTIKKGATTLINKQGSALVYEATRNNVVVRYAVIDRIIKISDAWVKTR